MYDVVSNHWHATNTESPDSGFALLPRCEKDMILSEDVTEIKETASYYPNTSSFLSATPTADALLKMTK
jgi:hypothetical protein